MTPAGVKAARKALSERARRGLETCTLERLMQADGAIIFEGSNNQFVNQSILDTLHHQNRITKRQFEAGDTFRGSAYNAGMVWSMTTLREPGSRRERKDDVLPRFAGQNDSRAFVRWARAIGHLGPDDGSILTAIVWPRDSGIDATALMGKRAERALNDGRVKAVLDRLADHYRLP